MTVPPGWMAEAAAGWIPELPAWQRDYAVACDQELRRCPPAARENGHHLAQLLREESNVPDVAMAGLLLAVLYYVSELSVLCAQIGHLEVRWDLTADAIAAAAVELGRQP